MINDLSETLRAVLTQPGLPPELARAHIVFDRPADPFNPTQTTVDIFLYDLRENLEMRANRPPIVPGTGSSAASTPALPLACTYLVTAWPVGGTELALQEQQLLGEVLEVLVAHPKIPAQFLRGRLAGRDPPPHMLVLHPDALKNPSEFWTSLGNKLRPSLNVTVTVEVPSFQAIAPSAAPGGSPVAGPS